MTVLSISIDDIIDELTLSEFINDPKELRDITTKCKNLLVTQSEKTFDRFEQIESTLSFIKAIWHKYDCQEIAEIYTNFIKVEEALYGLERDESAGNRYRDHFVHMVNCYIFGTRILSYLIKNLSEDIFKDIFKVENESLRDVGLPFGINYTYKQRIFYLWTIISTFHDIAIPFQHLTGIGKGINKFIQEFGWIFTDAKVTMKNYDSSQLYNYFNLLSSIYDCNLELIEEGKRYKRANKPNYYLSKILGREFDRRNHGVLSGFFMWKIIEEIFLIDRSNKYKFGIDEFNIYTEYVLEQDISRAALAISLHAIEPEHKTNLYPKIYPIRFKTLPLTFLLILTDELQEYLRWEGISLIKEMKFSYHPILDIQLDKTNQNIKLIVKFSLDSKNRDNIIRQAREIARHLDIITNINHIDEAVDIIGNSLKKNLEKKLLIGDDFKLQLEIFEDWSRIVYSKEFKSE